MRVLNFGSVNIDKVYSVIDFVQPGETISCTDINTYIGGKGCNQSVALARAGVEVFHAGLIGEDEIWIKSKLTGWGVNTRFLKVSDCETGHAIIQINHEGQNAILLYAGANHNVSSQQIDETLECFEKGDVMLLQNEINRIPEIIEKAYSKGLRILFNPAPMTKEVLEYPLEKVDVLIVNETEAQSFADENDRDKIIEKLAGLFENTEVLLTLGEDGSIYLKDGHAIKTKAHHAQVIDTTAAGDTFIGFFLSGFMEGMSVIDSLKLASKAAAISVSRKGGAISIPTLLEVQGFK